MISAFFDTLPFNIKTSVLPKYQTDIIEWCRNLFHFQYETILYSNNYIESYLRMIRIALKVLANESNLSTKKAVIYVPIDFDFQLKAELLSSIANIKFEHVQNDDRHEDIIDVEQLEESIKRDQNDEQSYPFMIIANAGTTLLGRCDDLMKMKQLCQQYNLWLHVTGDLLGSLSVATNIKENVNINCDSLTIDTVKLLGIQNLPYLTFYIRSIADFNNFQDERSSIDNASTTSTNQSSSSSSTTITTNNSIYDLMLTNPSISFLSIWSISQRCSNTNVLYHSKCSFDLATLLFKRLKTISLIRILNDEYVHQSPYTYKRICSGDASDDLLPKTVILFRFETTDVPEIENLDDTESYIDLLNLWLFDKLSQQYPKMNLELLKSVHFQMNQSSENLSPAHALRFAPLEHLLDVIDEQEMNTFCDDLQRYSDILHATMSARARLKSSIAKHENLISIPMPHWAGIGAIRYIPQEVDLNNPTESTTYDINTIQAELARKLQTNDSAFSLGGGMNEHDSMFYLRLGMIRKRDDLDILLQKIVDSGQETEISLKYVEDMAEKIKNGIEKVQQDLQNENQQLLAQEGLLRQLPLISNIMSWWNPSPSASPLATKGRSFDLNSGRVESTEDTYVYRMQINKQSAHAPTHNDADEHISTSLNSNLSTEIIPEEKEN